MSDSIAHVMAEYLPRSTTFIYTLLRFQTRYEPVVLARRLANLDEFPLSSPVLGLDKAGRTAGGGRAPSWRSWATVETATHTACRRRRHRHSCVGSMRTSAGRVARGSSRRDTPACPSSPPSTDSILLIRSGGGSARPFMSLSSTRERCLFARGPRWQTTSRNSAAHAGRSASSGVGDRPRAIPLRPIDQGRPLVVAQSVVWSRRRGRSLVGPSLRLAPSSETPSSGFSETEACVPFSSSWPRRSA